MNEYLVFFTDGTSLRVEAGSEQAARNKAYQIRRDAVVSYINPAPQEVYA